MKLAPAERISDLRLHRRMTERRLKALGHRKPRAAAQYRAELARLDSEIATLTKDPK